MDMNIQKKRKILQSKTTHDGRYCLLPNSEYHYERNNEMRAGPKEIDLPSSVFIGNQITNTMSTLLMLVDINADINMLLLD